MRQLFLMMMGLLLLTNPACAQKSGNVEFMNAGTVAPNTLPFSEAVRVNDTVYLSGMIGNIPGTLKLAPGGIKGQARQAMDNIRAVLTAHGYTMKNLVKCTVMLADIADWPVFNDVYKTYFAAPFPARSAFAASGLAMDARVEVECIAAGS
jgi:reactive intermediate/imine deaminase